MPSTKLDVPKKAGATKDKSPSQRDKKGAAKKPKKSKEESASASLTAIAETEPSAVAPAPAAPAGGAPAGAPAPVEVSKSDSGAADDTAAAVAAPAAAAPSTEAPAAAPAPAPHVAFVQTADEAEYERARRNADMGRRSNEIASQIKMALEKASVRTVELFREFDADSSGAIDKKEFETAILALGVKATPEEVSDLFDRWDLDSSGSIDFKEMDRSIKNAKMMLQRANTSAKEIQK